MVKEQIVMKLNEVLSLVNDLPDGDLAQQVLDLQNKVSDLESQLSAAKASLAFVNSKAKEIDAAIEDPA